MSKPSVHVLEDISVGYGGCKVCIFGGASSPGYAFTELFFFLDEKQNLSRFCLKYLICTQLMPLFTMVIASPSSDRIFVVSFVLSFNLV